ncbi:hypothetical protein GGX14DRAFT_386808 [Mycena pura]|uniref:Uncharacterized protein n=1 Tax=Mycena pura TaxID=153505 RepID=A0AAD6YQI4_9AGAR|nr:hypothetical protein GGX14DRAFT_386808 [Mycena pura]
MPVVLVTQLRVDGRCTEGRPPGRQDSESVPAGIQPDPNSIGFNIKNNFSLDHSAVAARVYFFGSAGMFEFCEDKTCRAIWVNITLGEYFREMPKVKIWTITVKEGIGVIRDTVPPPSAVNPPPNGSQSTNRKPKKKTADVCLDLPARAVSKVSSDSMTLRALISALQYSSEAAVMTAERSSPTDDKKNTVSPLLNKAVGRATHVTFHPVLESLSALSNRYMNFLFPLKKSDTLPTDVWPDVLHLFLTLALAAPYELENIFPPRQPTAATALPQTHLARVSVLARKDAIWYLCAVLHVLFAPAEDGSTSGSASAGTEAFARRIVDAFSRIVARCRRCQERPREALPKGCPPKRFDFALKYPNFSRCSGLKYPKSDRDGHVEFNFRSKYSFHCVRRDKEITKSQPQISKISDNPLVELHGACQEGASVPGESGPNEAPRNILDLEVIDEVGYGMILGVM